MIRNFKILGESVLKNDAYNSMSELEKIKSYLFYQSIVPNQKDPAEFAIAINFDTKKKQFRFELDKEIRRDNRLYFFAFSVGAPRDKKKFLATNAMEPLYSIVFSDAIDYLKKIRSDKKSKKRIDKIIDPVYDALLETMQQTYYIEQEKGFILNKELMAPDQKEEFNQIEQELLEKQKNSTPIPIIEVYKKFIEKKFPQITIAMIKIDGKHILDFDQYRDAYIQLVYYDLFERFFIKDVIIKNHSCHLCNSKTECTGKISFPMNFFGTTNSLFFGDLDNKKKLLDSFSICRDCLQEVKTGMKYIANSLNEYLLGIPCYLIPEFDEAESDFEKKYSLIFKLLKTDKKGYQHEIDEINLLIKKSDKKSFAFCLLFYDSPPGKQDFTVLKLISHLEYRQLKESLKFFDHYNSLYSLYQFDNNIHVTINTIRNLLFQSQKKSDAKTYRKDLLDLFSDFVYGKSISYHMCIKRFINKFKHTFLDSKRNVNKLSAFQLIIILSVFNSIKPLTGVKKMSMTNGNVLTTVYDERFIKFFETHKEIYENEFHRQGLFLLGTLINTIISEQLKKRIKNEDSNTSAKGLSSTFMKKLNFNGISPRRVQRLVAEVKNYSQIYNIYEPKGIWGNIMDRLQGIEQSSLNGEEIVFYILTGISFSNYLAMTHATKKQGEKIDGNN
ncbi:MAG: hypothetical protein HQK75_04375 [Candidatus Magnetomorum sp.]|nr:hypothetical protein [Candidatus Magnetomorum sp.]